MTNKRLLTTYYVSRETPYALPFSFPQFLHTYPQIVDK